MPRYEIANGHCGHVIGIYEAETPAAALDALAREAGYEDYAAACEVSPVAEGEIVVTDVTEATADVDAILDRIIAKLDDATAETKRQIARLQAMRRHR